MLCGTSKPGTSQSAAGPTMQSSAVQPDKINVSENNILGNPLKQNFLPHNTDGGDILAMASRSNFDISSERKTFNIERPIIQPMKGTILRLLGMSNIGDADDMGVWVTTTTNNPPIFESRNNAEKILNLCKDAGAELQEEAKAGAKEMIAFMWSQLQKELQKRIHQFGKPLMNKADIENIINDIFETVRQLSFYGF